MTISHSILHVVFNMSAAATLRAALQHAGRDDRVIGLADSLSFGPIDPPDPALQTAWVDQELEVSGWDEVGGQATSFWDEALSRTHGRVAWLTRRSTQEYAGFLELLWRLGDAPVEIVDLADAVARAGDPGAPNLHRVFSLGELKPSIVSDNQLWSFGQHLTSDMRAACREQWAHLKAENAPLRILRDGALVSAPMTYFDPVLLSCATAEWTKTARIIGEALCESWTEGMQIGDIELFARVRALVAAGRLQCRGDLLDMHRGALRLPAEAGDDVPGACVWWMRAAAKIASHLKLIWPVQSFALKDLCFFFTEIMLLSTRPTPARGAYRDRHETRGGDAVGARCRSMAFGSADERLGRTVKSHGPGLPTLRLRWW
ncbi:DUF3658 domain-containing protein [Bradyrhizobium oligotrophicum]|uniref:DUF3658 domain-containing protein n=1 Tax=Bradyrhizobium oligotrophicum TaxID=44255 RepID=UPI003EB7C7C5